MKYLSNNSINNLIFLHNNSSVAASYANLRQLGSKKIITIPLSYVTVDCFTAFCGLPLIENQVPNGTYVIDILDTLDEIAFSCTAQISGNDDLSRAYIVSDDSLDTFIYSEDTINSLSSVVNYTSIVLNEVTGVIDFLGGNLGSGNRLQVEFLTYPYTGLTYTNSEFHMVSSSENEPPITVQYLTAGDVLVRWWIASNVNPHIPITQVNEQVLTVTRPAERWLYLMVHNEPSTYYTVKSLSNIRFYNFNKVQSSVVSNSIEEFISNWNNDPANADFFIDAWRDGTNNDFEVHVVPNINNVSEYPYSSYIRVY